MLGIIGREHFEATFLRRREMESFDYRTVKDDDDGVPWVVETAFAWCRRQSAGVW